MKMQPLKVTFKVAGGWVSPPFPLHLDALLAATVTQRGLGDLEDDPSIEALRALGEELPLARHEQDGCWVWKASALVPSSSLMNDAGFFTQRRDTGEYARDVGEGRIQHGRYQSGAPMTPYQYQIDTLRGVFRNLLGFYPVQRPFSDDGLIELVAYCVGDAAQIEELLTDDRRPTHLGPRRRQGYGRIVSVEITEASEASEGWKVRVKPWALLADDVPVLAACKAPYWASENKCEAYLPVGL